MNFRSFLQPVVCFFVLINVEPTIAQSLSIPDTLKMDTIMFLNGEVSPARIIDTANNLVRFLPQKKKRKSRLQEVEIAKVFSLKFYNGEERIVYFHDSVIGNVFTVLEAKMFILGEREADKHYHNKWPFIIGFTSGLTSPLVLSNAVALSPFVPAVTPLHTHIPYIHINTKQIVNKNYLQYDTYLMGYERSARKKNFINSLIGSGLGLIAGISIWMVVK